MPVIRSDPFSSTQVQTFASMLTKSMSVVQHGLTRRRPVPVRYMQLWCGSYKDWRSIRVHHCCTYFLPWGIDSLSKYLENQSFGLLDDDQRRNDWHKTVNRVVELTPMVKQFPLLMPFVLKVPGWIMQFISSELNLVLLMHKI